MNLVFIELRFRWEKKKWTVGTAVLHYGRVNKNMAPRHSNKTPLRASYLPLWNLGDSPIFAKSLKSRMVSKTIPLKRRNSVWLSFSGVPNFQCHGIPRKFFLGSFAVHLSKRHFLYPTLDISIERKSGAPRFKPRAAGWEARTLPLCHAAPSPVSQES